MPKTYQKGEYTVTETDPIRIGFSDVYVFERTEQSDGNVYPRIIFAVYGDGANIELDTTHLPFSEQATKLVELFSKYI